MGGDMGEAGNRAGGIINAKRQKSQANYKRITKRKNCSEKTLLKRNFAREAATDKKLNHFIYT